MLAVRRGDQAGDLVRVPIEPAGRPDVRCLAVALGLRLERRRVGRQVPDVDVAELVGGGEPAVR